MVFLNAPICADAFTVMIIRKSTERGHTSQGWLDSYHSFSFADYHDARWMGFRSLRVLNDDLVLPGRGFGAHPHRDMEIITYLLSGRIQHKDSIGSERVLTAGDFQYMAAGRGVTRSESNPSKTEAAHALQIWIQPDTKGVKPRYAEKSCKTVATGMLHLVTSKTGRDHSIAIHQDADLWLAKLLARQKVSHSLAGNRHAWVHVAEGEIILNGTTLSVGDAAAVDGETQLQLSANKPSQVLLFDLN